MKVNSHSKQSADGSLRPGWTRLAALVITISIAAVLVVSSIVFFKLIGRRQEDPLARIKRHDEAHVVLFDRLGGQRVTFPTTDNFTLAGVVVERPQARGTVLFCHGYRGDKETMVRFIDMFSAYNLMLFDFRACGESEGDYTSIGCREHEDVLSAMRFIKNHPVLGRAHQHLIFGTSMGAAAAIKAAGEHPELADALFLDSPYACLTEEMAYVFGKMAGLPYYPFFPIMSRMFSWFWGLEDWMMKPEKSIKKVKMPLFLIHSSTDLFTQPHHSVRLYAEVAPHNDRARLWIGPPAPHTKLRNKYPEYYRHKVNKFLRKLGRWLPADTVGTRRR